jgi:hypothetical protein
MVLSISAETYTFLHVMIGLVGIGLGLVVMFRILTGRRLYRLPPLFFVATLTAILTGFGFPQTCLLPTHIIGILSIVVLAVTIPACCVFHREGVWRDVFVIGSATTLYLSIFVFLMKVLLKFPALHALAPTQRQKCPPFLISQFIILALFVAVTNLAIKKFHSDSGHTI